MLTNPDYITARDTLLSRIVPVGTERVALAECAGRVLAADLKAAENIPAFDRSPYDGYALRAADSAGASREAPVTLRITEEIPAGAVATKAVESGWAAKVLTGAPIPEGADAVVMFEKTLFDAHSVTVLAPMESGENIIRAGEDVQRGALLAQCGAVIDPGTAGTLAAQGECMPEVYRKVRVAILSTGSELVEADEVPPAGMIRNSNAHTLAAALRANGMEPVQLGIARDSEAAIAALLRAGLAQCDAVLSTGGVSVGDYDLTPAAMEAIGAEMLFRGADIKPGMACAYALCGGKPICALSGNPASSLTNFYAIALPALKKLAGRSDCIPAAFPLRLKDGFGKKSKSTRFLRGRLELREDGALLALPQDQGNVVLSSSIGCNAMALVPAGSGALAAGTLLQGFLI